MIDLGSIDATFLKSLSEAGQTITIIDESREIIKNPIERYDVFSVNNTVARVRNPAYRKQIMEMRI